MTVKLLNFEQKEKEKLYWMVHFFLKIQWSVLLQPIENVSYI
jgi:hypothetical protein